MLSIDEFNQIENYVQKGKGITAKQLVTLLQTKYLVGSKTGSNENPLKSVRGDEHIHVINPNRKKPEDKTRQKEQERGFKVRTQAEAERGEEVYKKAPKKY